MKYDTAADRVGVGRTMLGGERSAVPKGTIRRYPNDAEKRPARVRVWTWGVRHWYAEITEDDNPFFRDDLPDGPCWQHPWRDDESAKGRVVRNTMPLFSRDAALRWATRVADRLFPNNEMHWEDVTDDIAALNKYRRGVRREGD